MNAVAPALQVGDAREAVALLQLLSGAAHGVVQSDDGSYAGARRRLQLAELRAHLAGEVTLGVSVVSETKATFLALDIDERFHERLPYVSRAIEQRGLSAASIATSGSDSGRGKVLVFFAKRRAATSLRSLGNAILKTAREMASGGPWGVERPGKMTVFPLNGTGGLLRIGGRNRHPSRRASGVDVLFSLDGEPRRFQDVVPAAALRRMDPQPIAKAPVGVWQPSSFDRAALRRRRLKASSQQTLPVGERGGSRAWLARNRSHYLRCLVQGRLERISGSARIFAQRRPPSDSNMGAAVPQRMGMGGRKRYILLSRT